MFKNILCPIDGSDLSLQALEVAARFAADQGAALTICMIVDPAKAAAMAYGDAAISARCLEALQTEAQMTIDEAVARVNDTISARACAVVGKPVYGILDVCAANACDLIVIASHGRSGISRALIGSVAEGVIRHAGVPVMVMRWTKRVLRQAQDDTGDVVKARASMA
jgi:nucleotide-binding universal stress UspA family protein